MSERYQRSASAHERARAILPGGVNSPVRALKSVGGVPFFVERGDGCHVVDVDGHRYIDYIGAYGPLVLGHGHPAVRAALHAAVDAGTAYGAPTEAESELAELVRALVPACERMRLVNSGTEATMSALRVARGATGRDKILKFNGCYHGHADFLLVKAGSGALTFGQPSSGGVPAGAARDTLVAEFNDLASVEQVFEANPGEIAAVIVEPVPGNMGLVLPAPGFLEGLRALCDRAGTVLIFDEVMSGFRVALGGAIQRFGVLPDMVCLGKVIGGGLPVGAYGGRADLMAVVAPDGPVYQAGTLSGNPLAVAAGLATLRTLRGDGVFAALEATARRLTDGLSEAARRADVPLHVNRCGSMFTAFFTADAAVASLADVQRCDFERFARFFHGMRDRGVSLPPSQYEACFVSTAHDATSIEETLVAAAEVFATLRG